MNSLINEKDSYKKLSEALNNKLAAASSQSLKNEFVEANGLHVLIKYIKGSKRNDLVSLVDNLKNVYDDTLIIFIGEDNGGLPVIVSCSQPAIAKGNKAGDIVRNIASILGGSGGGRPEMASGAGKDASKINEALEKAKEIIK